MLYIGVLPYRLSSLPSPDAFARILSCIATVIGVKLTNNTAADASTSATETGDNVAPSTADVDIDGSDANVPTSDPSPSQPVPLSSAMPMSDTTSKAIPVVLTPAAAAKLYMDKKKASRPMNPHDKPLPPGRATPTVYARDDVETRVYLIEGIRELVEKRESLTSWDISIVESVFEILLHACDDYTTDNRGDVGSWVRMAAVTSLESIIYWISRLVQLPLLESDSMGYSKSDGNNIYSSDKYRMVMTAYGIGYVKHSGALESEEGLNYDPSLPITVHFPAQSTGYLAVESLTTTAAAVDPTSSTSATSDSTKGADGGAEVVAAAEDGDPVDRDTSPDLADSVPIFSPEAATMRIIGAVINLPLTTPTTSSTSTTTAANLVDHRHIITAKDHAILAKYIALTIHALLKQLGEKLDVVRATVGPILTRLIGLNSHILATYAPEWPLLVRIMTEIAPKYPSSDLDWSTPEVVYPFLCHIYAESSVYRGSILQGLVVSIGCINLKISRGARNALLTHLTDPLHKQSVLIILNEILIKQASQDRVTIPALKCIEFLLTQEWLSKTVTESTHHDSDLSLWDSLFQQVKSEMNSSQDVVKIKLCIDISILYIQQGHSTTTTSPPPTSTAATVTNTTSATATSTAPTTATTLPLQSSEQALRVLLVALGHRFAQVRKYTAEVLYMYLLSSESLLLHDKPDVVPVDIDAAGNTTNDAPAVTASAAGTVLGNASSSSSSSNSTDESATPVVAHSESTVNVKRPALFSCQSDYDQAISLLTSTIWENDVSESRLVRTAICTLLGVELTVRPKPENTGTGTGNIDLSKPNNQRGGELSTASKVSAIDTLESYSSLVREAGMYMHTHIYVYVYSYILYYNILIRLILICIQLYILGR